MSALDAVIIEIECDVVKKFDGKYVVYAQPLPKSIPPTWGLQQSRERQAEIVVLQSRIGRLALLGLSSGFCLTGNRGANLATPRTAKFCSGSPFRAASSLTKLFD